MTDRARSHLIQDVAPKRQVIQPARQRPVIITVRKIYTAQPHPHRQKFVNDIIAPAAKQIGVSPQPTRTPVSKINIQPTPKMNKGPAASSPEISKKTIPVTHVPPHPHHKNHTKPVSLKKDSATGTIAEHIGELRRRALWCVIALIFGGILGYRYQQQIIDWLVRPLGQELFYTSPTGGFDFLIKICLFFGFLLAIPVIVYNFMKFVSPAIPAHVTYKTSKLVIISIILATGGVAFAYFISLPAALHFLNAFSNHQIHSLISAQEYFNFVMIYLAGFAALFQMPLIIAFINKITPLTPRKLIKKQRVVILVSFIIAAFLTPTPDPINQSLMAMPIIGLYQASIGVVWQDNKRTAKKNKIKRLERRPFAASA